jgi:hypothetical protein
MRAAKDVGRRASGVGRRPTPPRGASNLSKGVIFIAALALLAAPADAEWLAPLTTETAETMTSGTAQFGLGASYFRNRRYPPFTPSGFIQSQNLTTVPELGFRIAAGSMVEIQASYEFINLDEQTIDGSNDVYGGGDARLFTKVYVVSERTWVPALGARFGVKLPNASSKDRLGTDETDFHISVLASKHFGGFATHVNLGIAILGNPGFGDADSSGQDDLFTYAVALVTPTLGVGPSLGAEAEHGWGGRFLMEVSGQTGSRFDNDSAAIRGGLQVFYGGLTLYAGVSGGLFSAAEKYGFMGGALYAFELERVAALFE